MKEAIAYFNKEEYDKAENILIGKLQTENHELASFYLGQIFAYKGDYQKAIGLYKELFDYAEEADDLIEMAKNVHQIGMVYGMAGDYDHAIAHFTFEETLLKDCCKGHHDVFSKLYYELSQLSLLLEMHGEARMYIEKAFEHSNLVNDISVTAYNYKALGDIERTISTSEARYFYGLSLDCFKKSNDLVAIKNLEELMSSI